MNSKNKICSESSMLESKLNALEIISGSCDYIKGFDSARGTSPNTLIYYTLSQNAKILEVMHKVLKP